jgi:hypothetical protein
MVQPAVELWQMGRCGREPFFNATIKANEPPGRFFAGECPEA